MYAKLALRNVTRQVSSYIIYFITVIFTVSLMFTVNNILFEDKLLGTVADSTSAKVTLAVFIGFITLIVGFIICYATAYLLRKRKKELGTYLLLGMKRSVIMRIFISENSIISTVSFILGCILGLGVFQIFSAVVSSLMGHNFGHLSYSLISIWLTFSEWLLIFFAATIYSYAVLKKTKIKDLINERPHTQRLNANPKKGAVIAIVAAVVIILVCLTELWAFSEIFYIWRKRESVFSENINFAIIMAGGGVLALAVFILYFFSKCFFLAKLNGKNKLKGSNIFHFRQISSALNRNAIIMGFTAILLSFSIIFTNFAFTVRYNSIENVNNNMPFDVSAFWYNVPPPGQLETKGSVEDVILETEKYSQITFKHELNLYDTKEYLWYEFDTSRIIKQSDLNVLLRQLKMPEVNVGSNETYFLINQSENGLSAWYKENLSQWICDNPSLSFWDRDFNLKGIVYGVFGIEVGARIFVVNDETLTPDEWNGYHSETYLLLNSRDYLPRKFYDAFAQYDVRISGDDFYLYYAEWTNVESKYYLIDRINADASVLLVAALFVSLTFMFLAMALLALKVMSDADKEKKRYRVLNMLGVGEKGQRKILFRHLLYFFGIPMIVPFFIAVPSVVFSVILSLGTLNYVPASIYAIGCSIPLVYMGIYFCYFAATYYLSVKNNISPYEKTRFQLLKPDSKKGSIS